MMRKIHAIMEASPTSINALGGGNSPHATITLAIVSLVSAGQYRAHNSRPDTAPRGRICPCIA
jgi:hypothetical protein